jgi:hypothetical protein
MKTSEIMGLLFSTFAEICQYFMISPDLYMKFTIIKAQIAIIALSINGRCIDMQRAISSSRRLPLLFVPRIII